MSENFPTDVDSRIWRAFVGACIGGFFGCLAHWVIVVAMLPQGVRRWGEAPDLFWEKLIVYGLCITSGVFVGMALACWRLCRTRTRLCENHRQKSMSGAGKVCGCV